MCILIIGTLLFCLAVFDPAHAEVIDWNARPATNLRAGATDTVTYGTSSETSVTSSGTFTGTFTTPNDLAIQPTTTLNTNTGILVSRFNATTDNESAFHTITLTFNEPVYNVNLIVGDIDGGPTSAANQYNDIVEFRGISPANAVVLPTSGTPNTPANVNWTAATGRATANNYNATANEGNITVVFAGPVKTLTIRHYAGANSTVTDPGQQMIFLETVSFTRGPRLVVQKTSTGGTGTFTFDVNNRLNAPSQAAAWTSTTSATNVTTTVAGTPVTGSNNTLFAIGTATTITETGPAGWLVTSASCSDSNSAVTGNPATFGSLAGQVVTIPATNVRAGSVITCSLNNIQQPRLTLVKTVTNDNGGTTATGAFTLNAAGPTNISGVSGAPAVTNAIVTAGTYALSEIAVSGYTASAWSCTAGTLTGSSLVLANGQNAVCTINNNDVSPRLTLVKTVTNDNGGTATTAAFTLSATGPTNISGISGSGTVTNAAVNAGTYTLSETNVAGYTAGAWSCTAGTLTGSSLVLGVGQTATCTINNNDIAPRLTLVKTVTNDNGGTATTSSVTLSATGPTTISGISGTAAVTNAAVNAGTYTLAETALANYTASAWSCTAGTLTGSSLVLSIGQTATCTINNDDIAPRLTLVKTVTNDNGGTATTSSVTLSATGPTSISGTSGTAAVTNAPVNAGTYTLAETALANYTASAWSCTAGTLTGSSLVLSIGQTATCTINNDDIAARLTLVKTVTNDNGGTATATSVTLSASGPTPISGTSGAPAVTNVAVNAGTYNLAETALANYTPSTWSCTAGTLTGSSLVLNIGQTATCTINNDDIAPRLTLVKTVTNDNGGTATTSAFTLTATGPTTISGLSGAATVTNAIVTAGSYALSETNLAGYAAGAWSCTAGTLTGSNLVIGIGQSSTCTINNNDVAPRLTLVKTVTNDNGGTATTTSVTLSATGPTTISGTSGNAAVTNAAVNAGTYALAETALANYTASAWSCTAGTLAGSNLTLALGQTATCTINNDDISPRLTLVKTITNDNGGTATTAAFTLSASGPTTISGVSGAGTVTNAAVNAGTYTLSETNLAGYAAGAWSCTAGTLTGSSLVLSIGQSSTCTINNNDIAPVLTLIKTVTDTSGGPSTVGAFTLTATGPTTITGVTGAPAVTSASVSSGTYTLSEAGPAGYTAGSWSCTAGTLTGSSLVLTLGQTSTCTINNVKLPTLTISKISVGGVGDFDFTGTNGVADQTITTTTAGGTFNGPLMTLSAAGVATDITETMPATFWQIQTTSCTGMGPGGTATLSGNVLTLNAAATAAGRNIVCTFTNSRLPTVSVQKTTTGAFGGAFSFADTNLNGTVANITTTATNTATPATPARLIATTTGTAVSLTETSPLSFVTAGVTCSDANNVVSGNTNPIATSTTGAVTIPATAVRVGADINCVFTNAQAVPSLSVTKTASVASVSTAGTVVTYTIAVNNTGNTTLSAINVTDPLGTVICPSSGAAVVTTLAPSSTENCTLSYTVPQSAFDTNGGGDGDIDNTATVSATYNASSLSANDSETVAVVITPELTIEKKPNIAGPRNLGDIITYTYTVTNSGNVTMSNVTISDAHIGYGTDPVPTNESLVSPPGQSLDAAVDGSWDTLAPGDIIEFTSSYTVVQADIDNLQ